MEFTIAGKGGHISSCRIVRQNQITCIGQYIKRYYIVVHCPQQVTLKFVFGYGIKQLMIIWLCHKVCTIKLHCGCSSSLQPVSMVYTPMNVWSLQIFVIIMSLATIVVIIYYGYPHTLVSHLCTLYFLTT